MSTKRYYWFKMPDNFFNQIEIKMLRKIAGGDTFVIIYLKLLLISLKNNGQLFFEGFGSDVAEEVALEIDEDLENVIITLNFLKSKGLMTEVEADVYELQKAKLLVGSESATAERMRRSRERKRNNVTPELHHGYVDIEKREDIDIEKKNICASGDAELPSKNEKEKSLEEEFAKLWEKYPNKKGKANALKSYKKHRKKYSYEEIEDGLARYLKHIKKSKMSNQYVKHGSTWFNQESWIDEYESDVDENEVIKGSDGNNYDSFGNRIY